MDTTWPLPRHAGRWVVKAARQFLARFFFSREKGDRQIIGKDDAVQGDRMMAQKQLLTLRKLKKREIEQLRNVFFQSSIHGDTAEAREVYQALSIDARIDLPLGELCNPRMAGWIWGWRLAGRSFITGEISKNHQFDAQGLEGMVSISGIALTQALLVSDETGLNRIEIFVPRLWTYKAWLLRRAPPEMAAMNGHADCAGNEGMYESS